MIEHMRSQHVEGSKDITLIPYIRKIDLMSSNSYILSGTDQIALIDPGGLKEQVSQLEKEVSWLQDELPRPVVVYLTHVHMDHWIQLKQGGDQGALSGAALAVQAAGADALEKQDPGITLADLLGRDMIKVPVELKLLSPWDTALCGKYHQTLRDFIYDYEIRSQSIGKGLDLKSQVASLGNNDHLEIYHTPGHSPDSICMQAGSLLFVGDLFFAPNPGMAGTCGWNHKDLLHSIQKVLWILENKNVQYCCSGHGKPIDAITARKTLESMYNDALCLKDLDEITPDWAKRTAAYAGDLMRELERISTIIAGRLAFIAHVLGELEETYAAEETEALFDPQMLDNIFDDFQRFSMELRKGKRLDLELVHKAGQTAGKLDKMIDERSIGSVMDQSLLRRASRLINDYSTIYRGYRPPYYVSYEDVNQVIEDELVRIRKKPYDEKAIILAESQEDFLRALKARIAYVDLFSNVTLSFSPDCRRPFARMDRERFCDCLIDVLERFKSAGANEIAVSTSLDDDWVQVRICGSCNMPIHPLKKSLRFIERSLALCGGLLQTSIDKDGSSVEIEFSALGDELAV
jgi:glyoxylase-like metal-dependent hydrolase (beta-lactamase superfamily II)